LGNNIRPKKKQTLDFEVSDVKIISIYIGFQKTKVYIIMVLNTISKSIIRNLIKIVIKIRIKVLILKLIIDLSLLVQCIIIESKIFISVGCYDYFNYIN